MYQLAVYNKKALYEDYDYLFKDFESFYRVANGISYAIGRRYKIIVMSERVNEIEEFIRNEKRYEPLIITICVPQAGIDYLTMHNTNLPIKDAIDSYGVYKELITKHNVLFEKNVMSLLYRSISHNVEEMEEAIYKIKKEYGELVPISEKMIESLFVINKIVYPREVLLAYLAMERFRSIKLEKSIDILGNDVVYFAMVKNMKQFMKEKVIYFKTGVASNLVKMLNTRNLNLMYRVLFSENCNVKDIAFLLVMYERGMSVYDLIRERES